MAAVGFTPEAADHNALPAIQLRAAWAEDFGAGKAAIPAAQGLSPEQIDTALELSSGAGPAVVVKVG